MDPKKSRTLITIAGLVLVLGFFLPWIDFGGFGVSGWGIARNTSMSSLIWLIPVGGLAMLATSLTGSRHARLTSVVVGLGLVGYAVIKTVHSFFATTGIGLWMIIAGALAALAIPLLSRSETER